MIDKNVSLDLMEFVEMNILPRYNQFDKAHNLSHATRVIRQSIDMARSFGADVNMAYVIAAYHDLGLEGPRAIHHITSGKILAADARLSKWFSPAQIKLMREAVEDHRASASHAPRSIYGKIVAEADRDMDPELDNEGHWRRFIEHMEAKYSVNGYIKMWLPGSDNERKLNQLRSLIAHPDQMRPVFDRIYKEEIS